MSNQKTWQHITAPEFKTSKRCAHLAFFYNNRLYVVGGFTDAILLNTWQSLTTSHNNIYHFDLITNEWKNDAIDVPKMHQPAGCVYKNKLYIFGGLDPDTQKYSNRTFELKLDTLQYSELETFQNESPEPRFKHSFDTIGEYGIVFGGCNHQIGTGFNDVWVFHFRKKRWITLLNSKNNPSERFSHATCVIKTDLYVFGGKSLLNYEIRYNDLYKFDLEEKNFDLMPCNGDVPPKVAGAKMLPFNNHLYLFGGFNGTNDLNAFHSYDLELNKWKLIENSSISGRSFHSMTLWHDGISSNMLIFGGIYEDETSKIHWNDLWILPLEKKTMQEHLLNTLKNDSFCDVIIKHSCTNQTH